jgi:hypothetical protein
MQVDEAPLAEKYNLVKLSVIGSTRISNRTATIAARLSTSPASEKTVIVALTAKHKAATKLISVVEIAKRDLVANGIKVYQYNALSSELIDMPRAEATEGITNNRAPTSNDDVHSDDAFETMQVSSPLTRTFLLA